MNLSLIEKFGTIFKFLFSSFLSIEMLILTFLLFFILVYNLKNDNKIVQLVTVGTYIGFIIGIVISYTTYVKTCVNSFVKTVMNYIYFPSTIAYFFIIIFVTVMMIFTLFNKKLPKFKKIINFAIFSIMYFFFMSFIALATYDMVDLMDTSLLYENNVILSLVQVSNFILVIWILFTGFYHLYRYFKRKYD
jgi:hypothetical protein